MQEVDGTINTRWLQDKKRWLALAAFEDDLNDKIITEIIQHIVSVASLLDSFDADIAWQERAIIGLVDLNAVENFVKATQKQSHADAPSILEQVHFVDAVLAPQTMRPPLSISEIRDNILSGGDASAGIGLEALAYSIYTTQFIDGISSDVAVIIFQYLKTDKTLNQKSFSWAQHALLTVILCVAYRRFDKRAVDEDRAFLLGHYLFRAVACGLPIRYILGQQLLACTWVLPYVNLSINFAVMFEGNKEQVAVTKDTKVYNRNLGDLCKEYAAIAGDKIFDEIFRKQYLSGLQLASQIKVSLDSLFVMYAQLRQAQLVDWLHKHVLSLDNEHNEYLLKLYVYFASDNDFKRIVSYFKTKPSVTPEFFLRKLSRQADLQKEEMLQLCIRLIQVLKDNKLLPDNLDFIQYDDTSRLFNWINVA